MFFKTLLGMTVVIVSSVSMTSAQQAFGDISNKVDPANLAVIQTLMQQGNAQCVTQVGTIKQLKISRTPSSQLLSKNITFLGELSFGEALLASYQSAPKKFQPDFLRNLTLMGISLSALENNPRELFVLPYYPLLELPDPNTQDTATNRGLSSKTLYVLQTCKNFYPK